MPCFDIGRYKLTAEIRKQKAARAGEGPFKVIIETTGKRLDKIHGLIEVNQGKVHREINIIPLISATVPSAALAELTRQMNVIKIWDDTFVYAMLDRVIPGLGVSFAQEMGYTGNGVVIAVFDTGIFPHDDLVTPENRILAWNDLVNGKTTPYDDHGHGTYVSGIIAGNGVTSNGKYKGMAPEARLVGVKVLDRDGVGSLSDLIAGMEWCIRNLPVLNIKVLNLSLGTRAQAGYTLDPLCRVIDIAVKKGITVCAAACGDILKASILNSPGIAPGVITVGNLNTQTLSTETEILNQGGAAKNYIKPDLVAPGTAVTSLKTNGDYGVISGASAATALVAGGTALILQKYPSRRPYQVKKLLISKAKDLGIGESLQGAGLLNPEAIFGKPRKRYEGQSTASNSVNQVFGALLNIIGRNFQRSPGSDNNILMNLLLSLLNDYRK